MITEKEFLAKYEELSDALFRHCYFRVFDREEAKDLVQDCFMKVWEYIRSGKEVENLKAFLYRVLQNLIIDRSRKKKSESLDRLIEEGFEPGKRDEHLELGIDGRLAMEHIKDLPDKFRQVITFRFIDGLGPSEIAQILNETENSISVRLNRAVATLRKMCVNLSS